MFLTHDLLPFLSSTLLFTPLQGRQECVSVLWKGNIQLGIPFLNHTTGGLSSSLCQASTGFRREQLPVLPAGTWVPVRFTTTWIQPQGWDYLIPPLSLPTASAPCRHHGQQSPQGRGAGSLMVPRTRLHFFGQCCSTPFRNGAPQFSSFPETPNHSATPLAPPLPPGVARENWRHKRPRSRVEDR